MKIRVVASDDNVFICEVDVWEFWGDGIRAYDKEGKCVLAVPGDRLVALQVLDDSPDIEE